MTIMNSPLTVGTLHD